MYLYFAATASRNHPCGFRRWRALSSYAVVATRHLFAVAMVQHPYTACALSHDHDSLLIRVGSTLEALPLGNDKNIRYSWSNLAVNVVFAERFLAMQPVSKVLSIIFRNSLHNNGLKVVVLYMELFGSVDNSHRSPPKSLV